MYIFYCYWTTSKLKNNFKRFINHCATFNYTNLCTTLEKKNVQTRSATHPACCSIATVFPFRGVERAEREADHSPPSSAKVRSKWSYTSTPPICLTPLNAKLNSICHLLALLGAHHILHVSRIRVNGVERSGFILHTPMTNLTLRRLMSYIYIYM